MNLQSQAAPLPALLKKGQPLWPRKRRSPPPTETGFFSLNSDISCGRGGTSTSVTAAHFSYRTGRRTRRIDPPSLIGRYRSSLKRIVIDAFRQSITAHWSHQQPGRPPVRSTGDPGSAAPKWGHKLGRAPHIGLDQRAARSLAFGFSAPGDFGCRGRVRQGPALN